MATKKQVVENEEFSEKKEASKTKKIATGNTKKAVQKRSSSVAAKTAKTATKKTNVKEQKEERKITKSKGGTSKKVSKKPESKKNNEVEEKAKVVAKNEVLEETVNETTENKEAVKKENSKEKTKATAKKETIKEDSSNSTTKEEILEKQEESSTKVAKTLTPKQIEEIKEVVKNELKANKKMPKEQEQNLLQKLFQNIILAVMVLVYFNFIVLGFINIESNVFLTDIKVFSMAMLIIAIIIFEFAYKRESGRYAVNGIEILVLAFVTMALLYINLMWSDKFIPIAVLISYLFCIYYVAKSIIIYRKMKKEYSATTIKEMLKK